MPVLTLALVRRMASSRFQACGNRDASRPQLPPDPSGGLPGGSACQRQFGSGLVYKPVSARAGTILGPTATSSVATSMAGLACSTLIALVRVEKSVESGAATSSNPTFGTPPRIVTLAAASAALAWATVAVSVNVIRMRVRDALTISCGCSEMSESTAAGKAESGIWALARSVARPLSVPTVPTTVSEPRSPEFIVEPYAWVPGTAIVRLKPPPGGIGPESNRPSSAVTLCVAALAFVQCTLLPALRLMAAG